MGSESFDEQETARLFAVIADSDAILDELRDSDDPVAIRRVLDALSAKASALSDLERFPESVAVFDELLAHEGVSDLRRLEALGHKSWDLLCLGEDAAGVNVVDELVELFDELECPANGQAVVARALIWKANALDRLGRVDDALLADDEVLKRWQDDPVASEWVAWSLRNNADRLVKMARSDEALLLSDRLLALVEREPDETLASVLAPAVAHLADLFRGGQPTLRTACAMVGLTVTGVLAEGVRSGHAVLSRAQPRIGSVLPIPEGLDAALGAIGPIARNRRRLFRAIVFSRVVIERVGASDEPVLRRLAATAQANQGATLIVLGRMREGLRTLEPIFGGEDSGAADALQALADGLPSDARGVFTHAARMSMLQTRADALAHGDRAVAQIAFDESVQALPAEIRTTRRGRWTAWLFRPTAGAAFSVPDHLPDADAPTS